MTKQPKPPTIRPKKPSAEYLAHVAECDGCSFCQGESPRETYLQNKATRQSISEVFKPGYAGPSEALQAMRAEVDAERRYNSGEQSRRAAKPRKALPSREALIVEREAFKRKYGTVRGWLTAAAITYDSDRKTITKRIK